MVTQALIFVVTSIGELFTLALLLRFLLQWLRAPARNRLSQLLIALTNFMVRPARRVIPGWRGLDLATLVLAWITEAVQIWLVLTIKGYEMGPAIGMALAALVALAGVQLAKLTVYILMASIVIQAALSWFAPYSAMTPVLTSVTRPLLRPFQKILPPVANVDLSPLAALFVCELLLILPLAWLELTLMRWL